ncbi:MAG: hypothetical protein KGS00_04350 [Alphaproteobacteria bacterium]|nr:hypothetical protein [Alphaproteobacteria bacterium]
MRHDPIFDPDAIVRFAYDTGIFGFMNSKWGWPLMETVHFIGLSMLIGAVGAFDLRMMGFARAIPLAALHRLVWVGVVGFALNSVSGALFFMSAAGQYLYNPAFQLKALAMLIAGLNVIVFYSTMARKVLADTEDAPIPTTARVMAAVSLISWLCAVAFGRLLTFFRPPYDWCAWCGAGG